MFIVFHYEFDAFALVLAVILCARFLNVAARVSMLAFVAYGGGGVPTDCASSSLWPCSDIFLGFFDAFSSSRVRWDSIVTAATNDRVVG